MIYVGINRFIQVQFCANDPDVFLEAVKLALEEIEVNMVTSTSRNTANKLHSFKGKD